MFRKKVVEKILKKTHFMLSSLLKNLVVCKAMWENTVESDRPQLTIWRMRIALPDN
jgi:hypothetical protein